MKAIFIHGTAITRPAVKSGEDCKFSVCIGDETPSGNVTLTITTRNGYVTTNSPLTFTTSNFLTPQQVTVEAVEDSQVEGIKYDYLTLTLSGGGYSTRRTIKVAVSDSGITDQFLRGYPGYYLNLSNPATTRAALIAEVFNGAGLPSKTAPDSVTANYTGTMHQTSTSALTNERVTKLVFTRNDADAYTWTHVVYHIQTTQLRAKKICFVIGGHGSESAHVNMIQDLLNAGCDVLYCAMPVTQENTENNPTINSTGVSAHNDIKTGGLDDGTYNPLELFFFDKIEALNYIQTNFPQYQKFYTCGCSGGGWTSLWLGALDSRISKVFDVRGVTPYQFVNSPANADYEQGPILSTDNYVASEGSSSTQLLSLYKSINYYDLMILASHSGRELHMIHHTNDSCCHTTFLYNLFFPRVQQDGKTHNCWLHLYLMTDPSYTTHSFNVPDRAYIIQNL